MQVSKKREIASADAATRGKNNLVVSTAVRCEFFNGSFHSLERGGFPVSITSSSLNLAGANSCSLPALSIFNELFSEIAIVFKNLIQNFSPFNIS